VSVRPGAEPYAHDGDDVGVLLCHGFTGNPSSLRPWAQSLADAGHTVRVPRLPGHGTTWRELGRTHWSDWYAEVETAFRALRARSRTVVVTGLSMGGALALRLAQEHPRGTGTGVDALVLVNPAVTVDDPRLKALPVVRWLTPWVPPVGNDVKKPGVTEDAYDRIPPHAIHSMLQGYRTVIADLPAVTQPLLLLRSTEDHVVPAASSALILDRIASTDTEQVLLENSYHVATIDNDAAMIFERTLAFIDRIKPIAAANLPAEAAGGSR
jgi:carboxylesterase